MEDIVVVEMLQPEGPSHFVMTWGRVQDSVDPVPLEAIVLAHVGMFGLRQTTVARVCESLREARDAPDFFEGLAQFAGQLAKAQAAGDRERWRLAVDAAMSDGRHLY